MIIKEEITRRSGKMNGKERQEYFDRLDSERTTWSHQDRSIYEFAENYVNRLHQFENDDINLIQVGPVDKRIFAYFVFSILIEYEYDVHLH